MSTPPPPIRFDLCLHRMVNPDLDGLEGKWDKDATVSEDDQLKIPTDSRLYAVMVRMPLLGRVISPFREMLLPLLYRPSVFFFHGLHYRAPPPSGAFSIFFELGISLCTSAITLLL